MKSKFILATLVIIVFYISLELAYATMILGMPLELAIGHQLPLRGVVVASILVIGTIIYRYLLAQKSKYNLHKKFEHLQNAVIGSVFSPAPLHVKAQTLIKKTLQSLPLSYLSLVHYRTDSIEIIDQQGEETLRLGSAIPLKKTTLHPVENLLLEFRKKKIPKHEASFNNQVLFFLSLNPAHLNQPIGAMVVLFKPGINPKNIHHDTLDFFADNAGFLLSLWSKKVQTLQLLSESSARNSADEHNTLAPGIEPYTKLQEVLIHEFKRHKRYGTGLTLLLFGVDFYENLCNIFGKEKVANIIKDLSIFVKNNTRSTDIFGQWEKEIFGIVLADNTFRQATSLARKLQTIINKRHFGHPIDRVSCSFGISTVIEGDTIETLGNRAKFALDKAKNEGGDRVEISLTTTQDSTG